MKKLRTATLIALALCMLLALSACKDKEPANSEKPKDTSSSVTPSDTPPSDTTQGAEDTEGGNNDPEKVIYKLKLYDGKKYIKTISAENGEYSLEALTKEGYTFEGFVDAEGKAFPASGKITADCTVNAKFSIKDTTTFQELKTRLEAGAEEIRIAGNITLTDSIFVVGSSTVYSNGAYTLTRSPSFLGDIFVVGETPDGKSVTEQTGNAAALTLKAEADKTLTVDGNKQNITAPVKGTAILVLNGSEVKLEGNITLQNCKKTANEKLLNGYITMNTPEKIGGAAVIVLNGSLDINGASFLNNEVKAIDETSAADAAASSYGGAIFNFSTVKVTKGTFTANAAARGGAIYNYRDTVITEASFTQNTAGVYGGAIYLPNSQFANLTLGTKEATDAPLVIFENNSSEKSGGAILSQTQAIVVINGSTLFKGNKSVTSNGGAINAAGALTIHSADFESNKAASKGGAIYIYYSDTNEGLTQRQVNIYGGSFVGNSASKGGAIAASASAEKPENKSAIVYIGKVTFSANEAFLTETSDPELPDDKEESTGTYNGRGGALYISRKADVTIDGATFTENKSGNQGGAIYSTGASTVTVRNSIFTKNVSGGNGGAIYAYEGTVLTAEKTQFTENKTTDATYGGGALYVSGSTAAITECSFSKNIASKQSTTKEDAFGGAMYITAKSTVTVNKSSFSENTAEDKGGAIYLTSEAKATVSGSTFTQNTATNYGGAISVHSKATLEIIGGSLTENTVSMGGGAISVWKGATVTITGAELSSNTAGTNGGAIYTNDGDDKETVTVTVTDTVFKSNSATEQGGAIYANGAILTVADTAPLGTANKPITMQGNVALDDGGAICSIESRVTLTNVIIEANIGLDGGAISARSSSTVTITNSDFNGNKTTVEKHGGAFYINKSTVTVTGGTFKQNESVGSGGAIYVTTNGICNLTDVTFIANKASENGGAIMFTSSSKSELKNVTITENTAACGGGVYFKGDATSTFNKVTLSKNAAGTAGGGGIYATECTVTLNDITFLQNTSEGNGGGFYAYSDATYTFNNVSFEGNTAAASGGAIYASAASGKISTGTVYGLKAVNNSAYEGGMLYITRTDCSVSIHSKAVSADGSAVISGNTATNAGNLIYSNSPKAKVHINFTSFPEWKTDSGYISDITGKDGTITIVEITEAA